MPTSSCDYLSLCICLCKDLSISLRLYLCMFFIRLQSSLLSVSLWVHLCLTLCLSIFFPAYIVHAFLSLSSYNYVPLARVPVVLSLRVLVCLSARLCLSRSPSKRTMMRSTAFCKPSRGLRTLCHCVEGE